MIYQCYFAPTQREKLFASPVYRGLGLEPDVNPELTRNCPELEGAKNRTALVEYGAMLHLWRNPPEDRDPWIGFTSYRQVDKFPQSPVFASAQQISELLNGTDVVGWGGYQFHDVNTARPVPLAEQG